MKKNSVARTVYTVIDCLAPICAVCFMLLSLTTDTMKLCESSSNELNNEQCITTSRFVIITITSREPVLRTEIVEKTKL